MKKIIILSTLLIIIACIFIIRNVYFVNNLSSTYPPLKTYLLDQDIFDIKNCIENHVQQNRNLSTSLVDSVITQSSTSYYYDVQLKRNNFSFQLLLRGEILNIINFVDYKTQRSYYPEESDLNIEAITLFEQEVINKTECLKKSLKE